MTHTLQRPSRSLRASAPGAWLLALVGLMLAACASHSDLRRGVTHACADANSAACGKARIAFQRGHYTSFSQDRLVAASSRALGDLNFETTRDDAQASVQAEYVGSAPTHKDQLDDRFQKLLRGRSDEPKISNVVAQVEVLTPADDTSGSEVRLRLYTDPAQPEQALIDEPALYQIFFNALGNELGGTSEAQPAAKEKGHHETLPIPPIIAAPTGTF